MPATITETPVVPAPKGYLTFKAIKVEDVDRVSYIGAMPVYDLIEKNYVVPVASLGLSPEILIDYSHNGPVQRKTNPAHVQAIADYIAEQAEKGLPWAFNSIVLYSTTKLEFHGTSIGMHSAGEATASAAFSVGEGLHRTLAWAVDLGLAKVKGVKRPDLSAAALKRVNLATIPVLVIEEKSLKRQKGDFHKLNQQKPLTSTVLALTDETPLSELTRNVVDDVRLFKGRIDVNNASPGAKSDKLLSFAQLRFVIASYLLGKDTRSAKRIDQGIDALLKKPGKAAVRTELKKTFRCVASELGGLERLHTGHLTQKDSGDHVRKLREQTLFASNALWRALFVALHDAKEAGVDVEAAMKKLKAEKSLDWTRDSKFFVGSLIDKDTGKLLSNRESIDAAADKLASIMTS